MPLKTKIVATMTASYQMYVLASGIIEKNMSREIAIIVADTSFVENFELNNVECLS